MLRPMITANRLTERSDGRVEYLFRSRASCSMVSRRSAIVRNAVLFLDGQAVASVEAGHLVLRAPLPPGARIDDDLTYHPPPRPVQIAPQAALPL